MSTIKNNVGKKNRYKLAVAIPGFTGAGFIGLAFVFWAVADLIGPVLRFRRFYSGYAAQNLHNHPILVPAILVSCGVGIFALIISMIILVAFSKYDR